MKKTLVSLAFAGMALTHNAQTWNTTLNSGSNLKLGTSSADNLTFYTNAHEGMSLSKTGDVKINNTLKVMGNFNINDNFNVSYVAATATTPRVLSFMLTSATSTTPPQPPAFKPLCNAFTGNAAVSFPDMLQVYDAGQNNFLSMGVSGGDGIIAVEPYPGGVYLANKLKLNPGCTNDVYICEGGGFTKIFNSAGVVGNLDVSNTVRIGGGAFGLQSSLDINTPPALAKAINVTNTSLGNIFNVSNTGTGFFSGKVGIGAATPGANLWVQDNTAAEMRVHSLNGVSKIVTSNNIGSYAFTIDNSNGIGHISSATDILNFRNTGIPALPQLWIGTNVPTSGPDADFNLAVDGKIFARKIHVSDAITPEIIVTSTSANNPQIAVGNSVGGYAFTMDNTGTGHISSGTNILNFQNTGSLPQVWIGKKPTIAPHNDFRLAIDGKLVAKSIYVTLTGSWADYVFEKNYELPKLADVEKYYQENKHLPEIPRAADVEEKGIDLATMNTLLLKKVEELTLYIVDQQKQIDAIKKSITK